MTTFPVGDATVLAMYQALLDAEAALADYPVALRKGYVGRAQQSIGDAIAAAKAAQVDLPARCPTCGRPVRSIFDHVDIECEAD